MSKSDRFTVMLALPALVVLVLLIVYVGLRAEDWRRARPYQAVLRQCNVALAGAGHPRFTERSDLGVIFDTCHSIFESWQEHEDETGSPMSVSCYGAYVRITNCEQVTYHHMPDCRVRANEVCAAAFASTNWNLP